MFREFLHKLFARDSSLTAQDAYNVLEAAAQNRRQCYYEFVLGLIDVAYAVVSRLECTPTLVEFDREHQFFVNVAERVIQIFGLLDSEVEEAGDKCDIVDLLVRVGLIRPLQKTDAFVYTLLYTCRLVWSERVETRLTAFDAIVRAALHTYRVGDGEMPGYIERWFKRHVDEQFVDRVRADAAAHYATLDEHCIHKLLAIAEREKSIARLFGSTVGAPYFMMLMNTIIDTVLPLTSSAVINLLERGAMTSAVAMVRQLDKLCDTVFEDIPKTVALRLQEHLQAYALPTDVTLAAATDSLYVRFAVPLLGTYVSKDVHKGIHIAVNKHHDAPMLFAQALDTVQRDNALGQGKIFDVVHVAQFLDQQDVYLDHTYRLMARRLLPLAFLRNRIDGRLTDDGVYVSSVKEARMQKETSALDFLKTTLGPDRRLKLLHEDITTTDTNITMVFNNVFADTFKVCINVCVMREHVWPLPAAPAAPLIDEPWITECKLMHESLLGVMGPNRRIRWHYYDTFTVETTRTARPCTLEVSMLQMRILSEFNKRDSFSLRRMCATIGGEARAVKAALDVLVEHKLLTKDNVYRANDGIDLGTDTLSLVDLERHDRTEVKKPEAFDDKEQLIVLQAAIVRHMKIHKQCARPDLLTCAPKLLFKPTLALVNRAIDVLLDKDYVKQLDNGDLAYVP